MAVYIVCMNGRTAVAEALIEKHHANVEAVNEVRRAADRRGGTLV